MSFSTLPVIALTGWRCFWWVWKPEVSCCSSALWHDRIVPVTSVSVVSFTLGSSQLSKCHSLECGTCLTAGIFPRWWLGLRFLWGRRFPSELEEAYIKKFFTVYFAGLESSFLSLTGLVATWATFYSEGMFKQAPWGGVAQVRLCHGYLLMGLIFLLSG